MFPYKLFREDGEQDYKEHHDNVNVHFVVTMGAKDLEKAEEQGLVEFFKLTSKINTSNMICFNFDGKIQKYSSPEEIIEEFYPKRLAYYQKRKVRRGSVRWFSELTRIMGCRITWPTSSNFNSKSSPTKHASSR